MRWILDQLWRWLLHLRLRLVLLRHVLVLLGVHQLLLLLLLLRLLLQVERHMLLLGGGACWGCG